jgi:predicted amidohydrolase
MSTFRIALANLRFPATREESVALAGQAIAQASLEGAGLICFPESFVPGYRAPGKAADASPRKNNPNAAGRKRAKRSKR